MGGRKGKKKSKSVSTPKKPISKPLLIDEDVDPIFLPSSLDGIDEDSTFDEGQMVCYNGIDPLHKELGGKGQRGAHLSTPLFTTPLRRIRDAILDKNGELSCICSGIHEEFCEICIDDASSFTGDERDIETRFEDVRSASIGAIVTKRDLDNKTKVCSAIPCDLQTEDGNVEDDNGGMRTTAHHTPKGLSFNYSAALGITPPAHGASGQILGKGEKGSGCIQSTGDLTGAHVEAEAVLDMAVDALSVGSANHPMSKHVTGAFRSTTRASENSNLEHGPSTISPIELGDPKEAASSGLPHQFEKKGKQPTVFNIPLAISSKGITRWENSIVGHFLGPYSPLHHVKKWAEHVLKCFDTKALEKGFYLLTFKNKEEVEAIVSGGPLFCGNKLFVTKKWTPGMNLSKGKFSTIPLWFKLHNIPLDLWTEEGINYIASLLGKPIHIDQATFSGDWMRFARVCIEIDASKDVMKKFNIDLGYGEQREIRVEIPWKPIKCKICKVFGHPTLACKKNPTKLKLNEVDKPLWKPIVVAAASEKEVKGKVSETTVTRNVEPPLKQNPWLTRVKGKNVVVENEELNNHHIEDTHEGHVHQRPVGGLCPPKDYLKPP